MKKYLTMKRGLIFIIITVFIWFIYGNSRGELGLKTTTSHMTVDIDNIKYFSQRIPFLEHVSRNEWGLWMTNYDTLVVPFKKRNHGSVDDNFWNNYWVILLNDDNMSRFEYIEGDPPYPVITDSLDVEPNASWQGRPREIELGCPYVHNLSIKYKINKTALSFLKKHCSHDPNLYHGPIFRVL